MTTLDIFVGNPIIKTDTEKKDVEDYSFLSQKVESFKNIEEVILQVNALKVRIGGKLRTYKYPSGATTYWLVEKLKSIEEGNVLTDAKIENNRLREIAILNGLI